MDATRKALEVIAKVSSTSLDRLEPDTELVADLDLDSARALELLVELEDTLGIEIADDDAARLNTVGDILAYIERTGR